MRRSCQSTVIGNGRRPVRGAAPCPAGPSIAEGAVQGKMLELAPYGVTANVVYPPVTDTGWITAACSGGGRANQRTNPRRLAQRRRGRSCLPLFGARPAHHSQRDPPSVTHAASRDLGSTGDRPDPGKCVRRRSGLRGTLSADAEVQIHSPRYGTAVAIGTCEISLKRPSSGGRRPLEPRHAYQSLRRRYWSNRSRDRPPIPLATGVFLMDRRGRVLARRRRAGSADP